MAVVRLLARPWAPLPAHPAEGLTASGALHTAAILLLASLPAAPYAVPAETPARAAIAVDMVDWPIGSNDSSERTPDAPQAPEKLDGEPETDGSSSLAGTGLQLDGLTLDITTIARQADVLFPFVTRPLPFLDVARQQDELPPDRLVNPLGGGRRSQALPPLQLDDAEYDRVVNDAWSRRVRWQSFAEIAALIRAHDPDNGDAPLLVRSHLDHNLLQPYFDMATRDPRYWVTLGLAADHEPFIQFVAAFVRDYPSSRTTTELLFMLDEFAQASRDAMLMLLDTPPDTRLGDTREADADAFALAQAIDRRYRGWAESNGLLRGDQVRRRFDDVRLRILEAILASTPDGYGAGDARFLIGRIYWERRDWTRALAVWRDLAPDERDAYGEASAALTREFALGDDLTSSRVSSILGAEYRRWLTYSADRLAQFGYAFDTF